jgi:hypothetical protein
VLRETTSRGLCGLVCPSLTSERGAEGESVKDGRGGEGELVPLVWESNPKLQGVCVFITEGGWCKTQPPAHRGI